MPKPEVVSNNPHPDDVSGVERQLPCPPFTHSASSLNLALAGQNALHAAAFNCIPLLSNNKTKQEQASLTEDELLITTPVVFGFSLADKMWCEHELSDLSSPWAHMMPPRSGIQHREDSNDRMESGGL